MKLLVLFERDHKKLYKQIIHEGLKKILEDDITPHIFTYEEKEITKLESLMQDFECVIFFTEESNYRDLINSNF
jgi:predicted oxidoreductase (fatty acid repression mutant protein)